MHETGRFSIVATTRRVARVLLGMRRDGRVRRGRRLKALGAAAIFATAAACDLEPAEAPRAPSRIADIILARDTEVLRALVPQRATVASLLNSHKLLAHEISALVATIGQKFDLRRFRAGQPYRIDRFQDGSIREFEYEIDQDRRLLVRRQGPAGPFEAELAEIPKTVEEIVVEGAITRDAPSLTQAIDAAGERIELSLALADVFSGEIDFNSDLQPGDTFRLLVQRGRRDDGAFGGYGAVLAAEYVNDGRRLDAIRFTPPGGKPGYYDAQGRSLKRFFLKSPLKFEPRITSAFASARRHPILDYTRAHNGVDYRAPNGAPVASVASGVVTFAGWTGGGGRTVRVRHASGYESEYLHLSSIASGIRAGARVGQGELVGLVGSTGLATGPHLHYGLRRDGAYVNPVREHQNMPPGDPVAPEELPRFNLERTRLAAALGDQGAGQVPSNPSREH
jgi:murein DD-endopeptidase MepM/ murein hydrolase activator NlpD